MASVLAPLVANNAVASPQTAPVRIAVSVGPWTRPRGLPSGAKTTTSPAGSPGTVDTTFTAMMSSSLPGMTSELPTMVRIGVSASAEKACSIARIASRIGRAWRVSAELR